MFGMIRASGKRAEMPAKIDEAVETYHKDLASGGGEATEQTRKELAAAVEAATGLLEAFPEGDPDVEWQISLMNQEIDGEASVIVSLLSNPSVVIKNIQERQAQRA